MEALWSRYCPELEMLYAVLGKEKNKHTVNHAFYIRDDTLSAELFGQIPADEKLFVIKERSLPMRRFPALGSLRTF